ncbi:MAG TPA: hypothetical protein VMV69_28960 [Pirellulales bacterium]|nr:hypothetical protein [Pirellulales bacterium]
MKTRLLLSLLSLLAAALACDLTADISRAGGGHDECGNAGCGPRAGCLRSAHQRMHAHWQEKCCRHRARHDSCACTRGRANCLAQQHSATAPWHGDYYDMMWGEPVALVVPPTADVQTHWNWGVGQTAITPIWHQYRRAYPGPFVPGVKGFLPTPRWPSSTDQFGVYYVRGPW